MAVVSQIELIAAIGRSLGRQGVKDFNPRQFNSIIEAANIVVEAFGKAHQPAVENSGLATWLDSDETGLSSLCMARHLGRIAELEPRVPFDRSSDGKDHPHDPSDFGRCVGLLKAVPELRPHVSRMAEASPAWGALAAAWDELEALYAEELPTGSAPKLYDRMRAIIDGVMTTSTQD